MLFFLNHKIPIEFAIKLMLGSLFAFFGELLADKLEISSDIFYALFVIVGFSVGYFIGSRVMNQKNII